jgi:membrane associated rhomboid family serine protease
MAYNNFGNSIQRQSPVVFNLIIINVLVYLIQLFVKQFDVTEWGALHYFKSSLFKPHQFVTNMFMHDTGSFFHILFNMYGLWMFGTILEKVWGSKKFLLFYLICGIGAGILVQFTIPYSAGQMAQSAVAIEHGITATQIINEYSAIGASGAIMGIMAAFAYLFPNTEFMIMFIPVPIKAKFLIPGYILIDLFGGLHHIEGDNVGHFAHLGGALVGFLLVLYWNKTNKKTFY